MSEIAMRHVPLSDLQASAAELSVRVDAGEEIVVTIGSRDYKLVATEGDRAADEAQAEKARTALAGPARLRANLQAKGVTVTTQEWVEWKNEGRR